MNQSSSFESELEREFPEVERYELDEGNPYHFALDRRSFVHVLGAGIVVSSLATNAQGQRRRGRGTASPAQRLHLGKDGKITVFTSKVEVGQGSRTQLSQAAAEELGVPVDALTLIMADSDQVPDDGGTAGSRTTPSTVPAVRKACAAARQFLLDSASTRFDTDVKNLSVENGYVTGLKQDIAFGYRDLAAADGEANPLPGDLPNDVQLKPVEEWQVLGTSEPRTTAQSIVTGKHRYSSDITRPNMLHGVVLRPPAYGAKLETIDLGPAESQPGVVAVRDEDFVGIAAPTRAAALTARDAIAETAKWSTPENQPSSDTLAEHLRENINADRRPSVRRDGEPEKVLADAPKPYRQSYQIAYIQHAPMEPRAAVAEWEGNKLTVWTGTQQPSRVHGQLAGAMRVREEQVRLIVPDTGGGFGGKHSGETAVEAARLAKAAKKPVSLCWSREEEFIWAYFRPAGVIDLAGVLDDEGKLIAWQQSNLNSGGSALSTPYKVPNVLSEYKACDQPLRSGSYRALASTANVFARECFMDELAAEAGIDPLTFRLNHLEDDRLRAVLIAATDRFQWKDHWKPNDSPQRSGVGLGCGTEKGSFMATCAEVEVDPDEHTYKVVRVCSAFECGAVQNPDNLRGQVEGCVLQGLGAVLREEIRFREGKILNPAFSQYHVPRLRDLPEIDTVLVNRPDLASVGGSETPIIGIAPAVANAIYNAVQVRMRSLPLSGGGYRPQA